MGKIVGVLVALLLIGGILWVVLDSRNEAPLSEEPVTEVPENEDIVAEPQGSPAEVRVGVNESGASQGLEITLEEVVADNRCPADAECMEAGAITVRTTLVTDEGEEEATFSSDEVPHEFGDYLVSIVSVEPELRSDSAIAPEDYQVTFSVISANGGEIVSWEEAVNALRSGEVEMASQTHALEVRLVLSDGRTLVTKEPEIDALFREIQACGEACEGIAVATE
jgi:hypothetical protein